MYACKYICNIAGCSTIAQSFTSNIFPLYKILHVGIYQKFLKNAFNFISNIYDKISVWSTYLMKMENYYLDVKDWGNLIGTNICTKLKVVYIYSKQLVPDLNT